MTRLDQIADIEREATEMERLEHELERLDPTLRAPIARAFRIASDRRAKLEQLRGTL